MWLLTCCTSGPMLFLVFHLGFLQTFASFVHNFLLWGSLLGSGLGECVGNCLLHSCEQLEFSYEGNWPLSNSWVMSTCQRVEAPLHHYWICKKWIAYSLSHEIFFWKCMLKLRDVKIYVRNCVHFYSFETNVVVYFSYYFEFLRKT